MIKQYFFEWPWLIWFSIQYTFFLCIFLFPIVFLFLHFFFCSFVRSLTRSTIVRSLIRFRLIFSLLLLSILQHLNVINNETHQLSKHVDIVACVFAVCCGHLVRSFFLFIFFLFCVSLELL